MTELAENSRHEGYRDQAHAAEYPGELQDPALHNPEQHNPEQHDGGQHDPELHHGELHDGELHDGELHDGELHDGELRRSDVADEGDGQSDALAYPDRTDTAGYPSSASSASSAGSAGSADSAAGAYPDSGHADPDALGTEESVLTRDPDAALNAGTGAGVMARDPRSDGDMRPDALNTGPGAGGDQPVVEDPHALMIRWQEVQTGFVDDPQQALHAADELVQQVMRQVQEQFAAERDGMEEQWSRDEDVTTEDLRLMLQRYRSFFNRLLQF